MTEAVVDITQMKKNIEALKRKRPGMAEVCLPVKANAYGHGAVEIARRLHGIVGSFAVARVSECCELRGAGVEEPILLFGETHPEEALEYEKLQLIPLIGNGRLLDHWEKYPPSQITEVHLMVDTGMKRLGSAPAESVALAKRIISNPLLILGGIGTHFATSDGVDLASKWFFHQQILQFNEVLREIKEAGINPGVIHSANSGAIISSETFPCAMGRPGIAAYGYSLCEDVKPVLFLETTIDAIRRVRKGESVSYGRTWFAEKDTNVGLLPVGYGDGYPRYLSNKGNVAANNKLYPVAGRVCMDMTLIDLGSSPDVTVGDRVVLIGGEGSPAPDAEEIAAIGETISYEVLTGIAERVKRIYKG